MRKSFILGSVVALALSGQAFAEDGFSYTYLDLGYANSELDDFDVDGDGIGLRGSLGLNDRFHVFASYSDLDYDFDVGLQGLEIGGGLHLPLNSNVDFVGTLSYLEQEIDVPGFGSADDDGFGLGAGLRGRVMERLELNGGLQYVDFSDAGDDTLFSVGGRYFFTDMFALGADVSLNGDVTTWTIGGRINFNK